MPILLRWYPFAQLIIIVWAEELSTPSSWGKLTTKDSREERIDRAAAAINALIDSDDLFTSSQVLNQLPDTYWPYGEYLVVLANFDLFTNQTRYKQIAQQRFLPALRQTTPNLNRYGYAATRAYLAYQDEGFLEIAEDYWASNKSLTISDEDVQSKSSPAKSTINSTMISLANASSNPDPAYMTLASQMGQFVLHTIYKGSGEFYNNIRVGSPDCPPLQDDSSASVSDAAAAMQALSVLGLNTKDNDTTDVLREIARRATGTTWNSADGVLDAQKFPERTADRVQVSQRVLQSYFHLALGDGASDLRTYLRAYLAIQYDALVKQATFASGVPNLYGTGLRPESQLIPEAQILAITTLLGGVISSDNITSPNDPRTTDATTPDAGSRDRVPIGAIVGGVIGGVLGLVLAIAGSYYYLRRRKQLSPPHPIEPYPAMSSPVVSPPSISTSLPVRSGKSVKRVPLASSGVAESVAATSTPSASGSQSSRAHEATTAELVTILNQRLRNERWDAYANESPPEYHRNL
ncbi:hypothetical protein PQX77_002992 [Marasmius sp. AFHP31]|nr:hypothetical protein PQX77_002992 [Marasmius sp. AFHP31]